MLHLRISASRCRKDVYIYDAYNLESSARSYKNTGNNHEHDYNNYIEDRTFFYL